MHNNPPRFIAVIFGYSLASRCCALFAALRCVKSDNVKNMRAAGCVLLGALSAGGVASAGTSITINGSTIQATGTSITVTNETVIVDGEDLSGNIVEGSGIHASEIRTPSKFDELQLNIAADITVTKGETARCVVTADDNILPLILTESLDGVLRITAKRNFASSRKVRIAIQVPLLIVAAINGSGSISLAGVKQEKLSLAISGSGDISANGKVSKLMATINGSGNVHTADLKAENAAVTINGSGNAAVYATAALAAEVNGSGVVRYNGTPPSVRTSVRGSGGIVGN